jgi:hypothetical protein
MLADGAIGFLFEGLIGLGRRDVFVLSPFRGWILFCFPFPIGFGRHRALGLNALRQQASLAFISMEKCEQGLGQASTKSTTVNRFAVIRRRGNGR